MTATINSNDINSVSFPGSEAGQTLIQLSGAVQVVAALSSVRVRLTAGASTLGKAVPSAVTVKEIHRLASDTTSLAQVSVLAYNKGFVKAIRQPAVASGVAAVLRKLLLRPTGVSSAVGVVKAVNKASRSASVSPTATGTANALRQFYRSATQTAQAVASAYALRKTETSASTSPTATALAATTAKFRLRSTTSAAAAGVGALKTKLRISASAIARSLSATTSRLALSTRLPSVKASALASPATLRVKLPTSASASAISVGTARLAYRLKAAASGVAQAYGLVSATDLGVTTPAPNDRRMTVVVASRRLEVTE